MVRVFIIWTLVLVISLVYFPVKSEMNRAARFNRTDERVALLALANVRAIDRDPGTHARVIVLSPRDTPSLIASWETGVKSIARITLQAFGRHEEAEWVMAGDTQDGVVSVFVIYNKNIGLIADTNKITPGIICYPSVVQGRWIGAFWSGPYKEQYIRSAKVLEGVCASYAPDVEPAGVPV